MAVHGTWTYGGLPIIPAPSRTGSTVSAVGAIEGNAFWCPIGPAYGLAYVYMSNADVQALIAEPQSDALRRLTITAAGDPLSELLDVPMCLIASQPLTSQNAINSAGVSIVKLGDRRYLASMALTCNSGDNFNVLRPNVLTKETDNTEAFYPETLNNGELWTTEEIVSRLWDSMLSVLGNSAPSIPAPQQTLGVPINICGSGRPAWEVINQVLMSAEEPLVLLYNPFTDSFSVQSTASVDSTIVGGGTVGSGAGTVQDVAGFASGVFDNVLARRIVARDQNTIVPEKIIVSCQRRPVRGAEPAGSSEEVWPFGSRGTRQWEFRVVSSIDASLQYSNITLWNRVPEIVVSDAGDDNLSVDDVGFTQRHAAYLSARSSARLWLALNGILSSSYNHDWDGEGTIASHEGQPTFQFQVGPIVEECDVWCEGVPGPSLNLARKSLLIADLGTPIGLHSKYEFRRGLPVGLGNSPGEGPTTLYSPDTPWSDAGPPDYARLTHTPFHELPQVIRICSHQGESHYGVTVRPTNKNGEISDPYQITPDQLARYFSARLVVTSDLENIADDFFGGPDATRVLSDELRDLVWIIDLNRATHLVDGDVYNARLVSSWDRESGTMPVRPVYAIDSAEKLRIVKILENPIERNAPLPSPSSRARILRHDKRKYLDPNSQDDTILVTDPCKSGMAKDQIRHVVFNGSQSRLWEVSGGGGSGRRRRFKLLSTLTQGGHAQAEVMIYDNGTYKGSGETITVDDEFLSMFAGIAEQRGLCEEWEDSKKNEIYQFPCPADETL